MQMEIVTLTYILTIFFLSYDFGCPHNKNVVKISFFSSCNNPSPPLADIVSVSLFIAKKPQGFKMCLLGRVFHTLIKNVLFPSPTDVGSHNPPPLVAQGPRWHTGRCLAMIL